MTVRDEAGQTASASVFQASAVKDPGSAAWTTLEPNDGDFSLAGAVALQGAYVVAAGVHFKNPQVIGTLRRYDQGGQWLASDVGWSKAHTAWTKLAWLKTNSFGPTGVAVDADQNIILVGIGYDNGQPRSYVARFHPDGALDWELASPAGTEARGVGVQPDGTIYVAGARRTGLNPERWDMEVSVYGPDKTAYGPIAYKDPDDKKNDRSERGRAVAVLKSGRVVILGTRDRQPERSERAKKWITRGVALLFEGKGKRVGDDWTSSGDKLKLRRDPGGGGHRRRLRLLWLRLLGPEHARDQEPDPDPLARRGSPGDQGAAPGDHARRRRLQRTRLQHGGRHNRRRARQRVRPERQPVDLRRARRGRSAG
ncbi:MAG: hypothetical protein IPI34_14915 [bacterium]|nr:hypothetical protein [bacterium]